MLHSHHLLAVCHFLRLSAAAIQLDFSHHRIAKSHPDSLHRRQNVQAVLQNAETYSIYLVNVTVGSDRQPMQLQLDTGSSDLWVPYARSDVCQSQSLCVDGAFNPESSTSFIDIGQDLFDITYVDGTKIQGDYFLDDFGLGGKIITNMTMGIATSGQIQSTAVPFQGIIGVGFAAGETITSQTGGTYPNVIAKLKSQGHIGAQAYSLWLNDLYANTGSILLGGVDSTKYSGALTALPVQPDADSGTLSSFTVVLDNFNVVSGAGKVQYSRNALAMPVILDSGTTLTYLPDAIAADLVAGVGATNSAEAGVYVPCSLANSPATLNFVFGNSNGARIQINIAEFVLPFPLQDDGSQVSLNDGTVICQWGILPSGSSPNLFGDTFLRSAYVVYDLDKKEVVIAQTKFNVSDSNIMDIGHSIPGVDSTASGVVVTQTAYYLPKHTGGRSGASATNIGVSGASATFDLSGTETGGGTRAGSAASGLVQAPPAAVTGAMAAGIAIVLSLSGMLMVLL